MKLFRFFKPEWKALLMVFLLLTVQAVSELALPGITSTLVNVGVQQDGIEDALAARLSNESMEKLFLLMDEADRAAVEKAYQSEGGVHRLRDGLTEAERALAREALTLPMAITLMTQALPAGILQTLTKDGVSREALLARIGPMLPSGIGSLEQAAERAAVQFVRAEYVRLGQDLGGIRNAYLWRQGIIMLGLTLLSGLTAFLTSFLSGRAGARVGKSLRRRVFARVLSFSKSDIDRFSTASLITRSTNDISQIQNTSVMVLRMLLYAPIMGLGGIWRVTQLRTGLGWIIAVTVALMISLVVVTASIVTPRFKILQKLVDRMNLVARENLTGVQVVRAFSREADENRRYEKANMDLTDVNRFINYAFSYVMPLMMLIINGVTLAILWFGAGRVDQGGMQVGDLIAFISYTMQIAFSFMMMALAGSVMLPRAEVAAGRVQEVLSTEPSITSPSEPRPLADTQGDGLRFNDVSFRYPDSQEEVLRGLSFRVNDGEVTAVIGATGSGKSSLLNLIPRFFDVTSGSITLDGVDIRQLDLHALRGQFGYVPQQATLFSGTIEENIRYADPDMPMERAEEAARIAQAEKFIAERTEGWQAPVAQGGDNLSGGQKQRLSIARAIAAGPRFLLFDDSFSALDYRTDLQVRQALKERLKGTGALIIAQRIATVMQADKILVLDDGRMAGQGTHRELMETCPEYQQIARSQLSDAELSGKGGERHV